MSRRLEILRTILGRKVAPQPKAPEGDSLPRQVPADKDAVGVEPLLAQGIAATVTKASPTQIVLVVLGTVGFLFFARPVVLPVFLACVGAITLKPLIRWLGYCHIPPALSAAVVLVLLVAGVGLGFLQLRRPALTWMNEAPQHMSELRERVQKFFPPLTRFNKAAAAMNNLGASEAEQNKTTVVEVKTSRVPGTFINWT